MLMSGFRIARTVVISGLIAAALFYFFPSIFHVRLVY
jgi:hypothetical protein